MNIYCLKCKEKTGNSKINSTTDKNGRLMVKSKCLKCGKMKSQYVKKGDGLVRDIASKFGKQLPNLPNTVNQIPVINKLANMIY